MAEPSLEKGKSPERTLADSLQPLFDALKEHLHALRPEDFDRLSLRFSGEVADYVGDFIKQIEAARKRRVDKLKNA
jgi:hypothetical protein